VETNRASTILSRVQSAISSETGVDAAEIKSSTTLASLVTDSLEMLNLLMELEGEFNLTLEEDDLKKIFTVQDVAKFIEEHAA
jgi:acyl carrier protein